MTTAIYCRLSKEDDAKTQESESIQNQRSLLIRYAVEAGWEIYDIYCDDDFRGCDRSRPAFNRMLADAAQGRFQVLLCKSQARFTRDMELVEKYIHGLFPVWGIRFVALADNADTSVKGNKKARQINGLVNEWYLEDLSENVRMVFDDKRRHGKYLASYALYGYRKDPADHNHLLVDPPAAEVVRRIFSLSAAGHGAQSIADLLNGEGVPNPTRYKRLNGTAFCNPTAKPGRELWNAKYLKQLLHNRMYLGEMVQGRSRKVSYKSDRMVCVPKEEWIVVPGTHEGIVDPAVFAAVQKLMQTRTRVSGSGEVHLFAGKVRCLDCGSALAKQICTYRGKRTAYLRCRLYANSRQQGLCTRHAIRTDRLTAAVAEQIRAQIRRYYDCDMQALLRRAEQCGGRQDAQTEIQMLRGQIERQTRVLRDLFLRKADGLLEEPLFLELSRTCIAERTRLEKSLNTLEELHKAPDSRQENRRLLADSLHFNELPRALVCALVEFIEVGERNPDSGEQILRIHWNF